MYRFFESTVPLGTHPGIDQTMKVKMDWPHLKTRWPNHKTEALDWATLGTRKEDFRKLPRGRPLKWKQPNAERGSG